MEHEFYTVSGIARICGCGVHNINYLIAILGISPVGRAGTVRLFSAAQVQDIQTKRRSLRPGNHKRGEGIPR